MQTQTLVRASADVVTITTLRPGDVFKRLEKAWDNKWRAIYSVVQTVDSNGEDAMVTALELVGDEIKLTVFGTDADLRIFAATPEEIGQAFADAEESVSRTLDQARQGLDRATQSYNRFQMLRDQVLAGEVQVPATEVRALEAGSTDSE